MATKKQVRESQRNPKPQANKPHQKSPSEDLMNDQSGSNLDNSIFVNMCITKNSQNNSDFESSRMVDQAESNQSDHDQFCYVCYGDGQLRLCTNCLRSFHKQCYDSDKSMQNQNLCGHCQKKIYKKCAECDKNLVIEPSQSLNQIIPEQIPLNVLENNNYLAKSKLICTLCFCQVHLQCTLAPLPLMRTKNYFFEGMDNFLCSSCMKQAEAVKILGSAKFLQQPAEVMYYFVNAVVDSPIHCFWVTQQELLRRKKNKSWKISYATKDELNFQDQIQCVVDFQPRFSLRKEQYCLQIKDLYARIHKGENPDTQYGSLQNYRFLVRWKSNRFYVWQEEKVLYNYIFPLKKFLIKCLFEKFVLENTPKSIFELQSIVFDVGQAQEYSRSLRAKKKQEKSLYITFGAQPAFQSFERKGSYKNSHFQALMKMMKERKTVEIVQKSASCSFSAELFCKCINQVYEKSSNKMSIKPNISIIVTQKAQIQKWKTQLQLHCPLLETLVMSEEEDLPYIKRRQFFYKYVFYPQFQILLTTYPIYLKEEAFISAKLKGIRNILMSKNNQPPNTEIIILDMFKKDFMQFSNIKFPDFNKFFILKQSKIAWLEIQARNHFPNLDMFKFNFQNPSERTCIFSKPQPEKHRLIFNKHKYSAQNDYCKQVKWSLYQRMCFHIYIMSFATNKFSTVQQWLKALKATYPIQFSAPITEESKKQCSKYLRLFFKLVRDYKGIQIPKTLQTQQFLFHIEREKVYKRICQLTKMKNKVEQYSSNIKNFPFKLTWKFYICKQIVHVKEWAGPQDHLLCSLILKYGFGNWNAILSDRTYSKIYSEVNQSNFQSYVSKILGHNKNFKNLDLKGIIQQRAGDCLALMN